MLFVTIGPVETAAIFASLTASVHRDERRSLALRSILISGVPLAALAVQFVFDGLREAVPPSLAQAVFHAATADRH